MIRLQRDHRPTLKIHAQMQRTTNSQKRKTSDKQRNTRTAKGKPIACFKGSSGNFNLETSPPATRTGSRYCLNVFGRDLVFLLNIVGLLIRELLFGWCLYHMISL